MPKDQITANLLQGPISPEEAAIAPDRTTDPNSGALWYLADSLKSDMAIEVESAWEDYSGKGVRIGVLDSIVRGDHADLDDNYDSIGDINLSTGSTELEWNRADNPDTHGTMVAGVIAAEKDNGVGTVGIAHEATITSFAMDYTSSNTSQQAEAGIALGATVDVLNCSWTYTRAFEDKLTAGSSASDALITAVEEGRDGLGTVVVFSAGNFGYVQSSNYHGYQNSPYTIAVGSVDQDGNRSDFSSIGSNLLVSAAGEDILTIEPYSGGLKYVSGTSFSAPLVSAAAALILEANEELGYRDVMDILALSARAEDLGTDSYVGLGWVTTGVDNFNGGGMHFSDSYGFGYLNVHDAVRLAETWEDQKTYDNLVTATTKQKYEGEVLVAGENDHIQVTVEVSDDITMDSAQIELVLPWFHTNDLEVYLTSPDGTVSQLVYDFDAVGGGGGFIGFPFTTNAVMGESAKGTWTIDVHNMNPDLLYFTGDQPMYGELYSAMLTVYGSDPDANDTYFYNDEYASGYYDDADQAARSKLTDTDGGTDTLNAAMVTSSVHVDLSGRTESSIGGQRLEIAAGVIENVYGGDAADVLAGSDGDNMLSGGRGDDTLHAGAGEDTLDGGRGTDTVVFSVASDQVISASRTEGGIDIRFKLNGSEMVAHVIAAERFAFTDGVLDLDAVAKLSGDPVTDEPDTTPDQPADPDTPDTPDEPDTGTPDTGTPDTGTPDAGTPDTPDAGTPDDGTTSEPETPEEPEAPETPVPDLPERDQITEGTDGVDRLVGRGDYSMVSGYGGDDTLITSDGDDLLLGGDGNDTMMAGAGDDTLLGEEGDDVLMGGDGNDRLEGGNGLDKLFGGNGADLLYGNLGGDVLNGGDGDDLLYGEAGDDTLFGGNHDDWLYGGDGRDMLNGGNGDDSIFGHDGNDTLFAGEGNDALYGGAGDDVLFGVAGSNTLVGGAGNDTYFCGEGADTLILNPVEGEVDRIFKFDLSEGDGVLVRAVAGAENMELVYESFGGGTKLYLDDGHSQQEIAFFAMTQLDMLSDQIALEFV